MRIRRASVAPYRQVLRLGGGQIVRDRFWIRLESTAGIVGLGDAAPWAPPRTASSVEVAAELVALLPSIEGLRFEGLDALLAWLAGLSLCAPAQAGVEIAALDLWTRHRGISFASVFAANPAASVRTNTLVGDEAAARSAVAGGAGTLKLKIPSVAALPALLSWARALGVRFRIDADRRWTVAEALAAWDALQAIDVEYLEDPLPVEDHAGWRALRAAGIPLALDEGEDDTLLDEGTARVRVLKPQFDGGLLRAAEAIRRYHARGQQVTVTSALESAIGRAATIHLARALAPGHVHGLGPVAVEPGWTTPIAGRVEVPAHVGLGVSERWVP